MQKDQLEKLVKEGLSTYKIATTLQCSQTNVRHWLRKYKLTTSHTANRESGNVCKCGATLKGRQTHYCSNRCKYIVNKIQHKADTYEHQKVRGEHRKLELISKHGGACKKCGYCKNYAALVFHHRDASNKVFNLDIRKCSNTNLKTLNEEAAKCDLLCSNCHAETHYPNCLLCT